jgi:hypothetical protein
MTREQAEKKAKQYLRDTGQPVVIFRDTRERYIEKFGEYGVIMEEAFNKWNYEHHVHVETVR